MENTWPIAYKGKITALVQYCWQNFDKMQLFFKNELIYSRRSHCPEAAGWPWKWAQQSGPFWVGRRDAGCLQHIRPDLMGTVGAPELILYQDSAALSAPFSGQELGKGKSTRFVRKQYWRKEGRKPTSSLRSSLIEGSVVCYLAKSTNDLCFSLSWRESWEISFLTSF